MSPMAGTIALALLATGSAAAYATQPQNTKTGIVTSVRSFKPVGANTIRGRAMSVDVSRDSDRGALTSLKTFTPDTMSENVPASSLLDESEAVTVNTDAKWGGIETLDVPQTESPAEKAAREQAEREAKEAEEQARIAAQQQATMQQQTQTTDEPTDTQNAQTQQTATGSQVIDIASQYIGIPYVYGGADPSTGFDCSGLTQYVYAQLGINLPHQSESQRAYAQTHGIQVSAEDAQPGDLMWHYGHVGIYAGNGMILHAPTPGDVVRLQDASYSTFEYYRLTGAN